MCSYSTPGLLFHAHCPPCFPSFLIFFPFYRYPLPPLFCSQFHTSISSSTSTSLPHHSSLLQHSHWFLLPWRGKTHFCHIAMSVKFRISLSRPLFRTLCVFVCECVFVCFKGTFIIKFHFLCRQTLLPEGLQTSRVCQDVCVCRCRCACVCVGVCRCACVCVCVYHLWQVVRGAGSYFVFIFMTVRFVELKHTLKMIFILDAPILNWYEVDFQEDLSLLIPLLLTHTLQDTCFESPDNYFIHISIGVLYIL